MKVRAEPEDVLPKLRQIVVELERLTEGLEQSLAAARESRSTDGPDD